MPFLFVRGRSFPIIHAVCHILFIGSFFQFFNLFYYIMQIEIINNGTQIITNTTTETGGNWTGGLLQVHETVSG
jgi:hypothetical protein